LDFPSFPTRRSSDLAFQHLSNPPFVVNIIESRGTKEFVLSNGALTEDPIMAELVYQPTESELRLAWDLTFYSQDYKHLWSIRIRSEEHTSELQSREN